MDTAAGQKTVAKRRSLGSIIRSRLSRAVKPSGRSLSADRAVQRPSDLEPATHNLDPRSLTPQSQLTYRTSVGKFPPPAQCLRGIGMSEYNVKLCDDISYT